jgi:hypothetical protein
MVGDEKSLLKVLNKWHLVSIYVEDDVNHVCKFLIISAIFSLVLNFF